MNSTHFTPELKNILKNKTPKSSEIFALIKRYKKHSNGPKKEELRDQILTINSKLVAHIAQKLSVNSKIPVEDLFQAGMTGLIHALDKFSHRKGFMFSTYASFWIKRSMQAEQNSSGAISISSYHRQAVSTLMREGGGSIDFSDMDAKKTKALPIIRAMNEKGYVFLDEPLEINGAGSFVERDLADPKDLEEEIFSKLGTDELVKVCDEILDSRERYVIEKRFFESKPVTYIKISKEFGLSSAEISRVIEKKAIWKLRTYFKGLEVKEVELEAARAAKRKAMTNVEVAEEVKHVEVVEEVKHVEEVEVANKGRVLLIGTPCPSCEGEGCDTLGELCHACGGWGKESMVMNG